jgi:hypothetical protein
LSNSEKLKIIKDIFGRPYRSGTEYIFNCPKCNHHKPKLSVNVDKGVFKCWVCDYSGTNIFRLIRSYGDYNQKKKWKELDGQVRLDNFELQIQSFFEKPAEEIEATLSLPSEFISLANNNLPKSASRPLKYLYDRGITKKDILYWKIGYCPDGEYEGRIIIPSFNMSGYANYFVARSYREDWRKYMNPRVKKSNMIFNQLYVDFQTDVVITEGVFDAIVAGPNSIPILGSTLKEGSKLFKEVVKNDTPIYVALDPDAEKKAHKLISNLLKYGMELYKIDLSSYDDVAEMGREEFLQRKKQAAFLNSENYLLYRISNFL